MSNNVKSIVSQEISLKCPLCGKEHVYRIKLGIREEYEREKIIVLRNLTHMISDISEQYYKEQEVLLYCPVVRDHFKLKLRLPLYYYFLGVDEIREKG